MKTYYVSVQGSENAHQPCGLVGIYKAQTKQEALDLAREDGELGRFSVYNGQYLSVSTVAPDESEVDDVQREEILEEANCLVCGKSVGELPLWQHQNAWCGGCGRQ